MWFTNAGLLTVIGLTRTAIHRAISAANTIRTAHLSRTTQMGITRIGIRSRTSLINTPTPGRTRLIVTTDPGTASGTAAARFVLELDCDS